MSLVLESITRARYDTANTLEFEIIASLDGAPSGTVFHALGGEYPDVDAACLQWLQTNSPEEQTPDPLITVQNPLARRLERTREFEETLDKINPAWWDSFTQAQKDELAAWRQAWLDYPNTPEATRPIKPDRL